MDIIEKRAMLKVRAAEKLRGETPGKITDEESRAATETVPNGTYKHLSTRGWIVWSNGWHSTEEGRAALSEELAIQSAEDARRKRADETGRSE